jgi:NAD(P)-dependent dehydrogenase (short-subunit alcohol dehydrogenase family)
MDLHLKEKVVVVSGGARGIGAATVRLFSREGARVVIVDRDEEAGNRLATELHEALFVRADLSNEAECAEAIATARRAFGAIDSLVNNAGVNDSVSLEAGPEEFMASLRRNLLHVYALTHHARADLIQRRGSVVNLSSKVATTGQGGTSGYAAAKGAINALTREWAVALAPHGVRVNAVVPAECDTDQYQRWFASQPDPEAARAKVARLVPLEQRLTRPDEMASAIVWLASPAAGHITGQLLYVDGGYTHLDRAMSSSHHW